MAMTSKRPVTTWACLTPGKVAISSATLRSRALAASMKIYARTIRVPHLPGLAGLILRSFGTAFQIRRRSFIRRLGGFRLAGPSRDIASPLPNPHQAPLTALPAAVVTPSLRLSVAPGRRGVNIASRRSGTQSARTMVDSRGTLANRFELNTTLRPTTKKKEKRRRPARRRGASRLAPRAEVEIIRRLIRQAGPDERGPGATGGPGAGRDASLDRHRERLPVPASDGLLDRREMLAIEGLQLGGILRTRSHGDAKRGPNLLELVVAQLPVPSPAGVVHEGIAVRDFPHQTGHPRLDTGQLIKGQLSVLCPPDDLLTHVAS